LILQTVQCTRVRSSAASDVYKRQVLINKADKKQVSRWVDASNVLITKLDLSDKERLEKLKKVAQMKNKVVEEEGEKVEQTSEEVKPEQNNTVA